MSKQFQVFLPDGRSKIVQADDAADIPLRLRKKALRIREIKSTKEWDASS